MSRDDERLALPPGSRVRFRLGDISCLGGDDALEQTIAGLLGADLHGRLVFLSGANPGKTRFAAVEVEGAHARVLVALEHLTRVDGAAQERAPASRAHPSVEGRAAICHED